MRKNFIQPFLLLTALIACFVSCKKDPGNRNPAEIPVELETKVRSSVSGFVTDENDNPVFAAIVKVGSVTTRTDDHGFFEAKNAEVTKNAATISVTKAGYFPGLRTYIAVNDKAVVVRIKLLPKTNAGSFDAAAGGSVTLGNGLKISLPANAIYDPTMNDAYTGTVNVAAQWLDPTAADLARIMPGDLRAIDKNNTMKLLVTYGMAAVELKGSNGQVLQVAAGKKAKLTIPLPADLGSTAPATIPLWYFDEAVGLWKEEGSAAKVGNTYEGEVSHFSFWNCDLPNNYVQFDVTVHDHLGNPIPNAIVVITNTGDNIQGTGYTDNAGYTYGAVPNDNTLKVEVYLNPSCINPSYTQTITTGSTNVSLGTIVINNSVYYATITGTVTNCSGQPVTNGAVRVKMNGFYSRYLLSNTGSFNILTFLCNGSIPINIMPEDYTTSQQGSISNHTVSAGSNPLGNFQACGANTSQFLNMTINGTLYSFIHPADNITFNNYQAVANLSAHSSITQPNIQSVYIPFNNAGIAAGSFHRSIEFNLSFIPDDSGPASSAPDIFITEFGPVGGFVSGNINTTRLGSNNTTYTITGNFRVRRYN